MFQNVFLIFLVLLGIPMLSEACSVCFSKVENDPSMIALRGAVICMLLILLFVLGLFAKFFLSVRKRSQEVTKTC